MLQEFEIAIARGHDVDQTKQKLIAQARSDYQCMCQTIEHDAKIAELIMYVLRYEPACSPGYAAARGLQKRFRKEYPEDDGVVRELRKALWTDSNDKTKRRGDNGHESNEGTAEVTGEPSGNDGSGEGSPENISTPIPGGTPG